MTITFRDTIGGNGSITKGSSLTYGEMDENFRDLRYDTTLHRVLENGNTSNLTITVESINANTMTVNSITGLQSTQFDGGGPTSSYTSGPILDCGGIT